jgi:hypothetical protein
MTDRTGPSEADDRLTAVEDRQTELEVRLRKRERIQLVINMLLFVLIVVAMVGTWIALKVIAEILQD